MTELEYVIAHFESRFAPFKGKRIVLHGSREYAKAIIDHFDSDFHFAGIMSRDPIEGEVFHGLPVLDDANMPLADIDMILLTERVKYAEAVYQDLHSECERAGILLYDMYGLDEITTHREIMRQQKYAAEWVEYARGFDIVVFETMDTLLAEGVFVGDRSIQPTLQALVDDLMERGADYRFSLRKSYAEDVQIRYLERLGILKDPEKQLIRRSGEDLSFRTLREENPGKRILYIGMGLVNECILPRYYGIETYRFQQFEGLMPTWNTRLPSLPYDASRKERIEAEILESDLVTFDVFDTLLVRKVLFPRDVFALTERRAKESGLDAEHFAARRLEAERESGGGTIEGIYAWLRKEYGWDEAQAEQVKAMELTIEREVTAPRREVVDLLDFAVKHGKKVVFVSDMYLPKARMSALVAEKGIDGYERILVSCDEGCDKAHGLFARLKAQYPEAKHILHIGDHPHADGDAAKAEGIKTEILPSPLAMAMDSGWKSAVEAVTGKPGMLSERCLLGQAIAEIFRDPFQNPNLKDRPQKERLRHFALGVLAPIAVGYLSWLISRLQEAEKQGDPYESVLFLARDGYLPMKIYEPLQSRLSLPKPVYFYANRHSTFPLVADQPGAASQIATMGKKSGFSKEDNLRKTYMLDESDIQPPMDGETTEAYLLRHMKAIIAATAAAKENYLRYAKSCGMRENGHYAICDGFAMGRTQRFLERALPFRLHGFNMGTYRIGSSGNSTIDYYFQPIHATILSNFIEIENFLLSTEPSLARIDAEGKPVFLQEIRSEAEMEEVRLVLSEAERAAREFFELFYREGETISPDLPEKMFAADGYHWVRHTAYDDWAQRPIEQRPWIDTTESEKRQDPETTKQ